jgi:paraquat-inducible protein B
MSVNEQIRRAVEKRSYWPGWIWAIPIAALGIVIWLGVRSWRNRGPEVTVIFPSIADLRSGDTQVKFQEIVVGMVESVRLEKDLRHMRVKLRLYSDMEGHLGKGTKFWIEGQGLNLENLSAIRTIVSGAYISIQPSPGPRQDRYIGLSEPPVLHFGEHGTPFILHTSSLRGIHHGTPIYYLDKKAGEVRNYKMTGADGFDLIAVIKMPFDKFVYTGTRFWNAGAVRLSSGANGLALQFQSLSALVDGAIAFETPFGPTKGQPGKPYTRFNLYTGREQAENAPDSEAVRYRVVFIGVSNSLSRYAPVELMGSRVGSVSEANLEYSPATGQMSIRAIIDLEPWHIKLANGESWSDPRRQMDSMMQRLVEQGLRAEISSSPPVIGGRLVVLRFVPGVRQENMLPGDIPVIPSNSGSDIGDVINTAHDIVNKIDSMPLTDIANNVHESTHRIATLVDSPSVTRTLHHIDHSASNVDEITDEAREQIPPTITSMRKSIAEAEITLTSAQALLSMNPIISQRPESAEVPQALYEVTRAARSLRELSDFLDRHPEALIRGRGVQ